MRTRIPQVIMTSNADEAAKAAWFAKRGPSAVRAAHLAKQGQQAAAPAGPAAPGAWAPSWGTNMIAMADMCNDGMECVLEH